MNKYRQAILSFLSGAAAAASMPPFCLWPVIILCFGVIYRVFSAIEKPAFSALCGWLFGFGYFTFGLYWIGNALLIEGSNFRWAWPFAVSGLPAMLAFFTAFAFYLTKKIFPGKNIQSMLGFVAIFSLTEWLRGHLFTGFPWNLTAYAWADNLPILQTLSIGGPYFLSIITISVGVCLGSACLSVYSTKSRIYMSVAAITILASSYIYGNARITQNHHPPSEKNIYIRIVQPNIQQPDKWDRYKQQENFMTHVELSFAEHGKESSKNDDDITLIVWPETAFSKRFLAQGWARESLKTAISSYKGKAFLLSGVFNYSMNDDEKPVYYNSLSVFDETLNEIARYNKTHLVPFGEYIPFKELIPISPIANFSGISPGNGAENIEITKELSIKPLICYEIIFPDSFKKTPKMRESLENNPESSILVNVTNDAWYGESTGPYQHYLMARYRAIEQGITVIRSANNGISGIFSPYGEEIANLPINLRGYVDKKINYVSIYAKKITIYCKTGDLLFFMIALLFLVPSLYLQYKK